MTAASKSENIMDTVVVQELVEEVNSNEVIDSSVEEYFHHQDFGDQVSSNTQDVGYNEDLDNAEVDINVQDNETVPKNENFNIAEENGICNDDTSHGGINRDEGIDSVDVYATVIFDKSPYASLQQEELESFTRCIKSMDHLAQNISNISVEGHNTYSATQNGRFQHKVQLRMKVQVNNLRESAREYIFQHLGRDSWDRRNGTIIYLTGIQ